MGYQGEANRTQEDYIFDTVPYNPEFNLKQLQEIEYKLIDYTSGRSNEGLEPGEAEIFLDWITFNAREYAVNDPNNHKETEDDHRNKIILNSMTGGCGPTQRINVELLKKFGLDAKPINMVKCIGEIPKTAKTQERIAKGYDSPAIWHAVTTVNIPINIDGYTQEYPYLLDPTFRQFCLEENCNINCYKDEGHTVAPHPGYFMKVSNLMELGVSRQKAEMSESIGRFIIEKGYFYLDDYLQPYVEAFRRAAINKEFQKDYEEVYSITGPECLQNIKNAQADIMIDNRESEAEFLKLPTEKSEKQENRESIFSKIKDLFKKIFSKNNTKALPEGKFDIPIKDPYKEFRKQYEFNGIVEGVDKGQVQQLDNIVRYNSVDGIEIGDE